MDHLPRCAATGGPFHRPLGVAVSRGLLLDLLATGDREGVDAAMDQFISMYRAIPEDHAQA
jgi:hypothetical protein